MRKSIQDGYIHQLVNSFARSPASYPPPLGAQLPPRLPRLLLSAAARPLYAAILFGATTPIGIVIGLGIRETYNPGCVTASVVSGVLDAFSAGVLI